MEDLNSPVVPVRGDFDPIGHPRYAKVWRCADCLDEFQDQRLFSNHVKVCPKQPITQKCPYCSKLGPITEHLNHLDRCPHNPDKFQPKTTKRIPGPPASGTAKPPSAKIAATYRRNLTPTRPLSIADLNRKPLVSLAAETNLPCPYCPRHLTSNGRREHHIDQEHTALVTDPAEIRAAKPLIKWADGNVYESPYTKKSTADAAMTQSSAMNLSRKQESVHTPAISSLAISSSAVSMKEPNYKPKKAVPAAPISVISGGRVLCTKCGVVVKPSNLQKHLAKNCPVALGLQSATTPRLLRRLAKSAKSKKPKKKSSFLSQHLSAPLESPTEYVENRRLDATRDFYQIRDHGRFGSHSSYDDLGDESAP